jgi:hypothetical protein
VPPPNLLREDEADEATWERQERLLRGDPTQEVAASLLLRVLSAVPAILALLLMSAWLVGEVVSDRSWWTQFLEWTPLVLLVPVVCTLVAIGEFGRRLIKRLRPSDPMLPRLGRLVGASAFALGLLAVYFIHIDLGGLRLLGIGMHRPEGVTPTRVLFWNSGAEERESWETNAINLHPDLCVFTSVTVSSRLVPLVESMTDDPVNRPVWTLEHDRFTILSRAKIVRHGFTTLAIAKGSGLDPREQGPRRYYDPGRAMYFELESSAFERPGDDARNVIVWVVDLPSDLSLPRALVTEQAAQAIASYRGPEYVLDSQQRWVQAPGELAGFPPADMIVGDFNIPRGSWSIGTITGMNGAKLENAWNQAGRGYTATYPRQQPLLFIDQIYLKQPMRAVDFGSFSTGTGTHRAVWADVVVNSEQ